MNSFGIELICQGYEARQMAMVLALLAYDFRLWERTYGEERNG